MNGKFKRLLGVEWYEGLTPSQQEAGNGFIKISPVQWVFLRHALIIAEQATHGPTAPNHQMSAHFLAGLAEGLSAGEGNSEETKQTKTSSEYAQKYEPQTDVHRSESATPSNKTQESPIKNHDKHPADSHSEGRTGNVAASTEQQAELEEQDSHDWMETSVSPFIKRLSDADLAAINAGVVPTSLMKLMGRVAYNEIERRMVAEPGADNGYGYTGSPDLGEVRA
ncbi:hypothetical protein CO583_01755 [Parasaccharibacter sp. TMW2.1882]|uniref:hypothetical protein n=1 Tax=Parasaccharibacter sp. TMW2.1882 TaxID=2039286 RepID=UPI0020137A72|nr:hypothetical protein [Parasaccharibacter sp. TMW2.1882]MCL1496235.1 hypothetical protein [Parasaccharibacter sp. TMW2.1882]